MRKARDLRLLVGGVTVGLLLLGMHPAGAASANISHSYNFSGTIADGSLVSLVPAKPNYVEPSNTSNGQQLLGVSTKSSDSLLAVDATNGLVQVATSGTVNTLVSTLNGAINVGDQVSVSPFDGIGMEASTGGHIIGLAQTAFNTASQGAVSKQVTDKSGHSATIAVGYVRLSIAIGTGSTNSNNDQNLNGLQKLAKAVTGHSVSTLRVVVSLVIAVISFVALVTLVYSSIYGGIISIGRNPLAKYAVFRTLASVFGMVILTAAIAGITMYLLLR